MSEIPSETRRRQRLATDPAASAFVAANAGSGKTYVLTRRVIRLLLSGCDPGRILCLTFTKAAAAEMSNRVFGLLGRWATLPDADLAAEIAEMEGETPGRDRLAAARRLFARALETPGGLKVQTIHAFAEALLQRFSVEANLPGRFEVMDDRAAALLLAEAKAAAVREAAGRNGDPLAEALAFLLGTTTDAAVDRALGDMVGEREAFLAWIRRHDGLDAALAALPAELGVPAGATRDSLSAAISASPDFPASVLNPLVDALDAGSDTMVKLAADFRDALAETDPERRRALWCGLFLTQKREPKKKPVTNPIEKALPGTLERFSREAERILALERALAGLEAADATAALARLADRTIGVYQALKAGVGALDYDDLILKAAGLLSRSDAAAWVQYKLDEGLDHVLVDEAQDTSPLQWQIVEALTADFFAGAGARGQAVRTVFAVGDEKQSIYSFQGAVPHLFGETREHFAGRVTGAGGRFHDLELTLSFRSTPDVVKSVDRVFAVPTAHDGLTFRGEAVVHETVRGAEPGVVEVWPEVTADPDPEPARWEDPVDRTGRGSAETQLAERIATEVARWLGSGERLPATGKRVRPGDVLILVRRRGAFVESVNRELKRRGVPIAGADRLDVIGHIVTQDLIAAARAALLPEDDLTLATVARSPLVGIGDDDLFRLAWNRPGSLWSAVLDAAGRGDAAAERLRARVVAWRERAETSDPHAFFAHLVGLGGARAVFRARFGREADEVIDELLGLADAFESQATATLQGFLCRLVDTEEEVKREVEGGRDEVRVMTVHGAKGLEAPIVFLVDPGDPPATGRHDPAVIALANAPGAPLVWVRPGLKPASLEAALAAERLQREQEYRRLLYVGMTRARDRLIVAGVRRPRGNAEGRWYGLVSQSLAYEAEELKDEKGEVVAWRWRSDRDRPAAPPKDEPVAEAVLPPLPGWLGRPPPAARTARLLTPSGASALLADTPAERAFERDALPRASGAAAEASEKGRLTHRLFELLPAVPAAERRDRALAFLARSAPALPEPDWLAIWDRVEAVIGNPRWAVLFGPKARAEVGIAGELEAADGGRVAVLGQIDRLIVDTNEILIVDFKTDRRPPSAVPEAYVAQLALYRAVIAARAGGRPVRAAILWTEAARLDEVPAETLDRTLAALLTNMGPEAPPRRS